MDANDNYKYVEGRVLENKIISEGIFKLSVEGKYDGIPGQFYMLKGWTEGPILAKPISIHSISDTHIEFLYQVVGNGTKILSSLSNGSKIKLLGPLGNGFDIDSIHGNVAIVSGGIGAAPMNYLIDELSKKEDCTLTLFSGFRTTPFGLDNIASHDITIKLATEDGSKGHRGYVTDMLSPSDFDIVLCCGPEVMMYKVIKMCRETKTPIFISEEKKMACGLGVCLGCTCKTTKGNKRTCKDGPVFNGEDIIC